MSYRTRPLPIGMLLATLGLLLAACTQVDTPASPSASEAAPTLGPSTDRPTASDPSPTPDATPRTGMPADDPLAQAIELARSDLATRLRVPPVNIEVISAERVSWPDGSLGCPQPDMSYTQAIVDGYRVILGTQGRIYAYHAGPDARPFMCESDEPDGGYDFLPPPGFDI